MAISFGVRKHIARWQRDGLIDGATAESLRKDINSRSSGFGLGGVLALLGAVLLGAAIVSLVAANWEAMPRLFRVGLIMAVLFIGYVGGAWRESSGDKIFSQALYLTAAMTFGAGIALVGQMYHLSGDAADAALLWVAGTMIAALFLRSPVLVSASVAITAFYLFCSLEPAGSGRLSYLWLVPILAFICAGLIWYTKGKAARHLIALLLIAYVIVVRFDLDQVGVLWLAALVGGAIFLADALRPRWLEQATHWSEALGGYGFTTLLMTLLFFQFELISDGVTGQVIYGFAILGCSVAGLALSGHRNLAVRWIAYTAFSLEVLYLAFETIGTMIGTAGFFLSAGVLVLLLATFVIRMERRLQKKSSKDGVTA
ncbi:DUF2157 domain-containing protein [Phyllobacterium brassicacearum]|uniref:DUF2157 domain-containing protein n=1 Tax=Phyllobacterium brassicacearum TaxID=314235 RepID=UPI0010E62507|nr:DUF2157 domain-containing protein [Phyllobacterium brassicacearum]TDQ24225.1 putative membrane protein [Phyllobacterium brassicacearum]